MLCTKSLFVRAGGALALSLLLGPLCIQAQQALLGNITGTVTDATGASVSGAKVVAHSAGTNLEVSAATNDS